MSLCDHTTQTLKWLSGQELKVIESSNLVAIFSQVKREGAIFRSKGQGHNHVMHIRGTFNKFQDCSYEALSEY